jgi:hypothetical protein
MFFPLLYGMPPYKTSHWPVINYTYPFSFELGSHLRIFRDGQPPEKLGDELATLSLHPNLYQGNRSFSQDLVAIRPDPLSITAVPTPAMLPGLVGFGVGLFRRRKLATH